MKKKLMSLALALVMCFSLCVPALAMDTEENDYNTQKLLYISEDEETNSGYKVTSTLNEGGVYTIRGYQDSSLIEEYIVYPGNYTYEKQTFNNGNITCDTVVVENAEISSNASSILGRAGGYMGTMFYNNIPMGLIYSISCTINNSTDTNSSWQVQSFSGSVAEWITKLIAALGISSAVATGCVESFLVSAAFEVISGAIHNKTTMTLKATVVNHTITGTSTSPLDSSYHSATLYGKTATITAPGSAYEGYTYRDGYSSADWGNNVFGRAMFKAVYNSDWTPTGWTD